jgi:hypothetical protein
MMSLFLGQTGECGDGFILWGRWNVRSRVFLNVLSAWVWVGECRRQDRMDGCEGFGVWRFGDLEIWKVGLLLLFGLEGGFLFGIGGFWRKGK